MNRFIRLLPVALAMFFVAGAAVAQNAGTQDLTGKWGFEVVYEGGSGSPQVTFTQKGDSLKVVYSSRAFGDVNGTGVVKGDEFEFWVTTSAGGDPFTMTFQGSIQGKDALKGTVELGGNGTATFTARRLPRTPPTG